MAWNKAIPDLLAVGYGSLNFHKEGGTGGLGLRVTGWVGVTGLGSQAWGLGAQAGLGL